VVQAIEVQAIEVQAVERSRRSVVDRTWLDAWPDTWDKRATYGSAARAVEGLLDQERIDDNAARQFVGDHPDTAASDPRLSCGACPALRS